MLISSFTCTCIRRYFRIEEEAPDDDEGRQRDRPREVCGVLESDRARPATMATRIHYTLASGDGAISAITAAAEHGSFSGRSHRTRHAPHGASPVEALTGRLVLKTSFGAGFEPATNDLSGRGSTQLSYPVVGRMGIEPMTYDLAVVALPLSYLPAADSISYAHGIRHGRAGRTGREQTRTAAKRRSPNPIGAAAPIRVAVTCRRNQKLLCERGKENAPGGKPSGAFALHGRSDEPTF